jgi:hypothetical protein
MDRSIYRPQWTLDELETELARRAG